MARTSELNRSDLLAARCRGNGDDRRGFGQCRLLANRVLVGAGMPRAAVGSIASRETAVGRALEAAGLHFESSGKFAFRRSGHSCQYDRRGFFRRSTSIWGLRARRYKHNLASRRCMPGMREEPSRPESAPAALRMTKSLSLIIARPKALCHSQGRYAARGGSYQIPRIDSILRPLRVQSAGSDSGHISGDLQHPTPIRPRQRAPPTAPSHYC